MSTSKIEWTEKTWSPITGCTKISPGCAHCYAERMAKRLAGRYGYPADEPFRVTLHPERLQEPAHWRKPRIVFPCSMSDMFHPDVPDEFINKMLTMMTHPMMGASHHTYLILTKRPERILSGHAERFAEWKNIWLGVTAENQEMADKRIPILLQIPAAVRFVSVEPMLGPVWIDPWIGKNGGLGRCDVCSWPYAEGHPASSIHARCNNPACPTGGEWRTSVSYRPALDWVICGGESGPGARPMHPDWVRSLRDQCQSAGVPFFFKQWGEYVGGYATEIFDGHPGWSRYQNDTLSPNYDHYWGDGMVSLKVGKHAAGRLLDGQEWNETPWEV
jgi:protein gp37